jgi:hypothetical protein
MTNTTTLYAYLDENWFGGDHIAVFLQERDAHIYLTGVHAGNKSAEGFVFPVTHTGNAVVGETVHLVLNELDFGGHLDTHHSFSDRTEANTYALVPERVPENLATDVHPYVLR